MSRQKEAAGQVGVGQRKGLLETDVLGIVGNLDSAFGEPICPIGSDGARSGQHQHGVEAVTDRGCCHVVPFLEESQ